MNIDTIRRLLRTGLVIPACPLALTPDGAWSRRHQVALARYYFAAGAGGVAVGVHSTQFAIRAPQHNLLRTVLQAIGDEIEVLAASSGRTIVKIAGVCGETAQATNEAALAVELGYQPAC